MLILMRRPAESIQIGEDVTLTVVDVQGSKVRLGITAPKNVPIDRQELRERKKRCPRPPREAGGGTKEDEE